MLEESYGLTTFDASQSKTVRLSLGSYNCDISDVRDLIKANVLDWASFTHKEALFHAKVPCPWLGVAFKDTSLSWTFSITMLREKACAAKWLRLCPPCETAAFHA